MRILITGANGYIGSSLVRELSSNGIYDVVGITRQDCDLSDINRLKTWVAVHNKFDVVINCASIGGNINTNDGIDVLSHNIMIVHNLLSLTGTQPSDPFGRLINIGSGAEFDRRYPIDSSQSHLARKPVDMYGISKYICNLMMEDHRKHFGIDSTLNLRIYGVFDENELDRRFIKSGINNQLHLRPIELYDKNVSMSFIYMPDFINIVKHFIDITNQEYTTPLDIDCVYDPNTTYTNLYDIAKYINTLGSKEVPILFSVKHKPNFNTSYCGMIYNSNILDSIPMVGLNEGIRLTYSAIMRNQLESN